MPTYEYECDACQYRFEEFQSITAKALRNCPKCGRSKLRRLIGPGAAIVFKGSGFYCTDYRSASYKKGAAADNGGSASSSSSASGSANGSSNGKAAEKSKKETKAAS
jgi:putative FmdB family regulatory protein